MKKLQFILLGLLFGLSLAGQAADVQSLRGAMDIIDPSSPVDIKKVQPDRDPIPRDYVQQPPLIPHKIDNYKITLKFNKCLTCHSWKNYKRYGATKISQTHFKDRDSNVLANVSARRYFCNQCHVPQVDAKPLVENEFKPVEALR